MLSEDWDRNGSIKVADNPLAESVRHVGCYSESRLYSYPGVSAGKKTYASLLRALGLERMRHRQEYRNSEQRNEPPPNHSITSSARARRDGGTVSPSVFAVFRLRTSSNFVGC